MRYQTGFANPQATGKRSGIGSGPAHPSPVQSLLSLDGDETLMDLRRGLGGRAQLHSSDQILVGRRRILPVVEEDETRQSIFRKPSTAKLPQLC